MSEGKVDEDLYSRQLYVLGHEAQRRMQASDVLIVGMNGLGVETAKNVILAGVKSVCLHDNTAATWVDLSSNFYITESDLGKSRAEICLPKLAELNPYVPISLLSGELTTDTVLPFKVVVLIDVPLSKQIEIADFCHIHNICVIVSDVMGVFGKVFCDFGQDFTCYDVNGEPNAESMAASITNETCALVTTLEDTRHQLETGDVVTISGVVGITELEGREFKVTVKDPYSFEIDMDTTNAGIYVRGGYINQVKQPKVIHFENMTTSMLNPGEITVDFAKYEQAAILHLAFQAISQFQATHGHFPVAGNITHANMVYDLTKSINDSLPTECSSKMSVEDLSKQQSLIHRFSMCSRGMASPICALMGGIVGQEVLKASSGKFMPIKQWCFYDAFETLSEEALSEEELTPMNCRYDGQIMIYGKTIQKKLNDLKVFCVGAGAIGCEMMKNFALMGIACASDKGMVYITDMDQIERSNLSRQFLFRNSDINCCKSTTAVSAVTKMNPQFQAKAFEHKVGPETEMIFNDDFFDSLDFVFTALDNVQARLYVDQRCVFYRKPMLESGTLGTKSSTQVVVPGVTEHYGATRDPPEKSIPICTLKHFPNLIEHTLAWARDWFEEAFKQMPADACTYLSSAETFHSALANQQNVKLEALKRIKEALLDMRPESYRDCIHWAREKFEDKFSNTVKQLLHNFPHDKEIAVQNGNGRTVPFWSGAKKPPTPLVFDATDALHIEFVTVVANLRAKAYGIVERFDFEEILRTLSEIVVEKFQPSDGVAIPTTEEEAKTGGASTATSGSTSGSSEYVDVDAQCDQLLALLPARESFDVHFHLNPFDFEKDDDDHMRVVAACSNLRARNYAIPEIDLHRSRGIAGKILPAIATTTALATGAICLELFKVLQNKPIEQLMNYFSNLAIPIFTHEEPGKPACTKTMVKGQEWKWSVWDRVEIDDPGMTLEGLMKLTETQYGCELTMLSAGESMLYGDYMDRKKTAARKPMTLKDLTEMVTKKPAHESKKFMVLEVLCQDSESGEEVDMPSLRFRLR